MLLWLWYRLAGEAQIQPLARELPYAAGAALKRKKEKKKKERGRERKEGREREKKMDAMHVMNNPDKVTL